MKTLLLVIVTAAICYVIFKEEFSPIDRREIAEVAISKATAAPAPPPSRAPLTPAFTAGFSPQSRALVQGHVAQKFPDGIIVHCQGDPPATSGFAPGLVSASSGAGDIRAAAEWAIRVRDRRVLEEFGPVLELRGAALARAAISTPEDRAEGTVFLAGSAALAALDRGSPVRVVAAATGQTCEGRSVFTVDFSPAPIRTVRAIVTPSPTPDPRAVAAEIERKYGSPQVQ